MKSERRKEAMGCIKDAIARAKSEFKDPYIVITGDTNKMSLKDAVEDYPDVKMHNVGPTRGNARLDVVGSNFEEAKQKMTVRPPLSTADGRTSDHG